MDVHPFNVKVNVVFVGILYRELPNEYTSKGGPTWFNRVGFTAGDDTAVHTIDTLNGKLVVPHT
jgi:hypothetical protein